MSPNDAQELKSERSLCQVYEPLQVMVNEFHHVSWSEVDFVVVECNCTNTLNTALKNQKKACRGFNNYSATSFDYNKHYV